MKIEKLKSEKFSTLTANEMLNVIGGTTSEGGTAKLDFDIRTRVDAKGNIVAESRTLYRKFFGDIIEDGKTCILWEGDAYWSDWG